MMHWLIKFYDNWADEMDVEGFVVYPYDDYINYMRIVHDTAKKIDSGKTFELYFGTNEWIEYSTGEEFLSCFNSELIGPTEANILNCLLVQDYNKYGHFPIAADMLYFLEEESEGD